MRVDEVRPQGVPAQEIRAGAQSAKGLREENQDAMTRFRSRFGEVILVADGMGGHLGGATASDMVAQRFRFHLDAAAESTMSPAEALQQAATRVNDEIYERGHSGDPAVAGMGSTLVVAILRRAGAGQEVMVANAGDSRAYLIREGVLRQLTRDHTAAQRMVDAGMLSAAEARTHPQASVLSRALGQQIGVTVETYPPVTLLPGDGLLLCSDGLSGFALDPDIATVIESAADPNAVVKKLVELALSRGSDDNITVQFLRLGPAPELPPVSNMAARPRSRVLLPVIAAIVGLLVLGSAGWLGLRLMKIRQQGSGPHDLKKTMPIGGQGDRKKTDHDRQKPVPSQRQQNKGQESPSGNVQPAGTAQPAVTGGEAPGANGPNTTQQTARQRIVLVYVPRSSAGPKWLRDLEEFGTVKVDHAVVEGFPPDPREILVFYRPAAEKEFDRMAKKISELRGARRAPDDSIPTDILIVMPNRGGGD